MTVVVFLSFHAERGRVMPNSAGQPVALCFSLRIARTKDGNCVIASTEKETGLSSLNRNARIRTRLGRLSAIW